MTRKERHHILVKYVRKQISLRFIKIKRRREKYPNGGFYMSQQQIRIFYKITDSLDWIDSLIIHEYGHFKSFLEHGLKVIVLPPNKHKKKVLLEILAWKDGMRHIPKNLIPKRIEWIKNYCLDTYRFQSKEADQNKIQ